MNDSHRKTLLLQYCCFEGFLTLTKAVPEQFIQLSLKEIILYLEGPFLNSSE